METNRIRHGDCKEIMGTFPANCIDLTVTSPPYDNLRKYKGFDFDFEGIANQLFRITKPGGVVVWVVGDATVKGSETGTSFKQALYFKEIGFNLHDTMIWNKTNAMPQVDKSRYTQCFEYMFVLSKGKPNVTNMLKVPTKNGGKYLPRGDGNSDNINKAGGNVVANERIDFNIYKLAVGNKNNGHPAVFPEKLANDQIISWSNKGDLVLDPFCGSGTTCKMAVENDRNYIGIEISEEYVNISKQRCSITKSLIS